MEFETFFLVSSYVPNSGDKLQRLDYRVDDWDSSFQSYLLSLPKPVVLTGDLNVAPTELDIYDTKGKDKVAGFTPRERDSFTGFLTRSGWVDAFRALYPSKVEYTFWSVRQNLRESNKGWRLDYFIVAPSLMN